MSIGQIAARGVAWNMAIGVIARALQLIGTVVLTRLIAPEEYGEVLIASICVITASQLSSFAFGQYLIANRAPPAVAFQAAVLHVGMGLVTLTIVVLCRAPLGRFLDAPEMGRFVLGFAAASLIDRLRYVPERVLIRSLRFRPVALINGVGEISFTVTALALASRWSGTAIMIATIVRSVLTGILFLGFAPRAEWLAPTWIRADAVRGLFGYGWPIMVGSIADRAASWWDNLIISRMFNAGVMARYNQAYNLAQLPVGHVAEHIAEVLMPSFSRMDREHRRSAVLRAAALMVLVVAPLGVGLSAVAPTLVPAIFDARWAAMAPMLSVLGAAFVFQPLPWSAMSFLQAEQQTRLVMVLAFLNAILVLVLVATLGALGGPVWACVGDGIGFAGYSVATILLAARLTGFSARAYLIGVGRPLLACVPMYIAVTMLRLGLEQLGTPLLVSLVMQIAVGGIVYVAMAFIVARSDCRQLIDILRRTLRKS